MNPTGSTTKSPRCELTPFTLPSLRQPMTPAAPPSNSSPAKPCIAALPTRERFAPVLRFTREQFRIFYLLGRGMTQAQIANLPGEVRDYRTTGTHVAALKAITGKTLMELVAYSAAFQESGLRRIPNPNFNPYIFAPES